MDCSLDIPLGGGMADLDLSIGRINQTITLMDSRCLGC
jgi:hypothetical protein